MLGNVVEGSDRRHNGTNTLREIRALKLVVHFIFPSLFFIIIHAHLVSFHFSRIVMCVFGFFLALFSKLTSVCWLQTQALEMFLIMAGRFGGDHEICVYLCACVCVHVSVCMCLCACVCVHVSG